MSDGNKPIHLYFSRDLSPLKINDSVAQVLQAQPREIRLCTSWSDLPTFLAENVLSICVDAKELQHSTVTEIVNMIHTLFRLVGKATVPMAIAVWADTLRSVIRDLQRADIHGIIPVHCDFNMAEAVKGCHALWNGVPYWPRHIIDQLPCERKIAKSTASKITLTPRQQQIIDIVTERGSSNKTIARMLGITESTVKLHISGILKKYGVRNRTQLALFARDKAEA